MTAETQTAVSIKAPPNDKLAESITLGAMMLSPSIADAITEIVTAADFYRPVHSTIFKAIEELARRGEPFDGALVAAELAATGDIERVGGAAYLATLVESVPVVTNGPWYARRVADLATRRRIAEAGAKVISLADQVEDVAEVREQAQQAVYDAASGGRETAVIRSIGDLVGPTLDQIEKLSRGEVERGIPTGIDDYDRLMGGGHRGGQLIIPAGRTSMGKSILTQNWTWHAAKVTKRPCLLFSVEMRLDEMMIRLLAEVASVNHHRLRTGNLAADEFERLAQAEREIREVPLFMVDNVRTTPGIRAYIRRFRAREGDLALFSVDYLQNLTGVHSGRRPDRHLEVGEFAKDLKITAQDNDAVCLAPCQLNRGPESRPDKTPTLSDLRESGDLEQTADVAVLIYRPSYYDKGHPRAGEADLIVAKNRNGATDTVSVAEQLHFQRFRDMASDY